MTAISRKPINNNYNPLTNPDPAASQRPRLPGVSPAGALVVPAHEPRRVREQRRVRPHESTQVQRLPARRPGQGEVVGSPTGKSFFCCWKETSLSIIAGHVGLINPID